jgi:hypothetical protein
VLVVLVKVPPPLTIHATPALFLSFVTIAVRVEVSPGSTVEEALVTATLMGGELLPQQSRRVERLRATRANKQTPALRAKDARGIRVTSNRSAVPQAELRGRANSGQSIFSQYIVGFVGFQFKIIQRSMRIADT